MSAKYLIPSPAKNEMKHAEQTSDSIPRCIPVARLRMMFLFFCFALIVSSGHAQTAGSMSLVVTDTSNSSLTATATYVQHNPGSATTNGSLSIPLGDTVSVKVSITGTFDNSANNGNGTVTCSSTGLNASGPLNPGAGSPLSQTFSYKPTASGAYPIRCTYNDPGTGGNTPYSATTGTITLNVGGTTASTLYVSSSVFEVAAGSAATFVATISNGITSPTIEFLANGTAISGCTSQPISGTTATCTTSSLAQGVYSITAYWAGNASYSPATSTAIVQVITASNALDTAAFSVSVTSSTAGTAEVTGLNAGVMFATIPTGQALSIDATDAPNLDPTNLHGGTVTCYANATSIATSPIGTNSTLANTDYTFNWTFSSAGNYEVFCQYSDSSTGVSATTEPVYFTVGTPTAAPTFSPAAGTYATAQTVTISDSTSGAVIYYTTDGTTPTTLSTKYTAPISVSLTGTLLAFATSGTSSVSPIAVGAYTITLAATPVISLAAGTYTNAQIVTISDATPGATIYYTTNGATPATSSNQYIGPILVSASQTLKAIAIYTGYTNSAVASAVYTITPPPAISVVSSNPSSAYGSAVYFTATISSWITMPNIKFYANGVAITNCSSVAISGGQATCPTNALAIGKYLITATYPGNLPAYPSVTSAPIEQVVNSLTPSITWATPAAISQLSPPSIPLGSALNASAGSVTGTFAYQATTDGETATTVTSATILPVGEYTLTATFTPSPAEITAGYTSVTAEVPLVVTSATADYGTATLTVNGTQIAQVNYGATSTQSTIAAALATAASGNSLVNVTVVDNALYLESKATDGDYAYSLSIASTNSLYTSNPSFESEPASGNLTGGDASNTSGQTIYGYTASYDAASNLLSDTDSVMGPWSFSYDTLNRLTIGTTTATTGQYVGQHLCWSYDDFGNRTAQVLQTGACTSFPASATYYPNNQISWTSANNAGSDITYDAAGNVVFDGVNAYLYDGEGRLCAVRSIGFAGYGMTGYIYDADGTRVAKGTISSWSCNPAVNGFVSSNEYVLDLSGQQLSEWAMSGSAMAWQHTNVFAAGKLIATYDGGTGTYGLHFYANDALGTRRAQTDYAGVLEQTCSSLPYGDQLSCTGSITAPTEHHFTGRERDLESGNDYFAARYYSSAVGRFMSPDWAVKATPVPYAVLGDPQTLNLYGYLRNNPLGGVDADGHCGNGPDDPPCTAVKVQATVTQQPAMEKNTPVQNSAGQVIGRGTGPTGGQLTDTVTVNGKPAANVQVAEHNSLRNTENGEAIPNVKNENPSTVPTNSEGQIVDGISMQRPAAGSSQGDNAIVKDMSTNVYTSTDKQTLTLTFPSGGTCTATSTRIMTNAGMDGQASSTYTLGTTQPVVHNPSN